MQWTRKNTNENLHFFSTFTTQSFFKILKKNVERAKNVVIFDEFTLTVNQVLCALWWSGKIRFCIYGHRNTGDDITKYMTDKTCGAFVWDHLSVSVSTSRGLIILVLSHILDSIYVCRMGPRGCQSEITSSLLSALCEQLYIFVETTQQDFI